MKTYLQKLDDLFRRAERQSERHAIHDCAKILHGVDNGIGHSIDDWGKIFAQVNKRPHTKLMDDLSSLLREAMNAGKIK